MRKKSFVFSNSSAKESRMIPSTGFHYLNINPNGQIEVVNHKGEVVNQDSFFFFLEFLSCEEKQLLT